ncbi:MAG: cyclohexanecarboxyl-CoA dehydrogenase [Acetobacteraceae bacterium]|nr:cyclohexanecarboxyl-CoA dehydrogenase [Acetobacteraceae bacterium]
MIDSALTEEQRDLAEVARRFACERIAPGYMVREQAGRIDRDLVREMGSLGLIGTDLPEAHGGLGAPAVTTGLAIEAVSYADLNVGYVPLLASLNGQIVARHAAPALAAQWIPRIVAGEALFALALTEPRGGSDAANLQLVAKRDGGDYVLRGEKTSISMADQADAAVVFARTGEAGQGARGISAFLVPMDLPGISRTRFRDLGSHAVGRGSIFFDDVRIPAENRLAEEGMGFVQVMQGFDYSRALIGLQVCATAQASLDESWAYIQEREAFNTPIAQFQGVSFPLAEGEGLIQAVRQLCFHTLRLRDEGRPHTAEAAMCKWLGPKTAVDVIHQCLLTHGHYGWSLDLPHQQRLRDVMGLEIGDGTAQVTKLIVARERAGRVAVQYQAKR